MSPEIETILGASLFVLVVVAFVRAVNKNARAIDEELFQTRSMSLRADLVEGKAGYCCLAGFVSLPFIFVAILLIGHGIYRFIFM